MKPDKSLAFLVKELDGFVSKYVRLEAADSDGYCKCVCCDIKMHWTLMDCAHFVTRRNMSMRFYLPNLAPASKACNQFDPIGHILRWRERLTQKQFDHLQFRSKALMKFTRSDLKDMIETYKKKVAELRKQKHI